MKFIDSFRLFMYFRFQSINIWYWRSIINFKTNLDLSTNSVELRTRHELLPTFVHLTKPLTLRVLSLCLFHEFKPKVVSL